MMTEESFDLVYFRGPKVEGKTIFGTDTYLMKCLSGDARVLIGTTEHVFSRGTNFMLADGVLFKFVEPSDDFVCRAFRFSNRFFNVIYPMVSGEVIEASAHTHPDLYDAEARTMLDLIFRQMQILYTKHNHPYRYKMAVNLIVNYMLVVYEQTYRHIKDSVPNYPNDRMTSILCQFYELCNTDALRHRNVEYYAERLHITSRYLFRICKENSGLTPKQAIDFVIVGKAKKLLLTTMLSFQQISNDLCFPDQTAFAQYFKRNVGMTPTEFRAKYR